MDRFELTEFTPVSFPHPGEMVAEYLTFNGWSQRDLARRTGITPKTISEICNGKAPISPVTALKLEQAFQRPARLWLNMQRQFDEAEARQRELANSQQWGGWAQSFPLKEMRNLKFSLTSEASDVEVLLKFFGVSSPESFDQVWKSSQIVYRQTRTMSIREQAIAAWVRETELVARQLVVDDFDSARFIASLGQLRKLTRLRVGEETLNQLQEICARCGVAIIIVPALPNTGISGCARWLSERKALIGLTLRYKTDDQFWFTVFHEIGHIVLHKSKRTFVLDNADKDLADRIVDPEMELYEMEANRFAANTLIPQKELDQFLRTGVFDSGSIHDFAEKIGVGPGIVVGRLQFEGVLRYHQGNSLKQNLSWGFKDGG